MEVKAQLRYYRIAPRKARLVVGLIKRLSVSKAKAQLANLNKKSAPAVLKLLNSAIANATNNFSLEEDNLYVKNALVNQAPALKRWKPRAHGRAGRILKFSSHILIVLDEIKLSDAKKAVKKVTTEKDEVVKTDKVKKSAIKKDVKPKLRKNENKPAKKGVKTSFKTFTRKAGDK